MDWADACSLGRLPSLNRYFLLILDKGTDTGPLNPIKHEAWEFQSSYCNNTLLQQAVRPATCALKTQKNSPRKKWWISAVKMTLFCNLWSQPYHAESR